ncbi:hypothetical protein J2T57_000075 [Natronocella acetinitrilica]|uniref:Uncharacterized protein n=1 Tax=Natronocella acetinitrilica TaxID=414046 RepID=A0AAE3G0T0_9GAMM|nr:hypothetical protein [Natronocella acetinitrilica]
MDYKQRRYPRPDPVLLLAVGVAVAVLLTLL